MSYTPHQLASAYIQAGELADALAVLDAHLADHADDDAHRLRGSIRLRLGQYGDAQADYDALHAPTPSDFIAQSLALTHQGKSIEALACLTQAMLQHPNHDALTMRYVELLIAAVQLDTARDAILARLAQKPSGQYWRVRLADVLALQGEHAQALTHYSTAIHALPPDAAPNTHIGAMLGGWLCARAATYAALGDLSAATQDYTQAMHLLPHDPMIPLNIGLLAHTAGDNVAVEYIQQAWRMASAGMRQAIRAAVPDDLQAVLE